MDRATSPRPSPLPEETQIAVAVQHLVGQRQSDRRGKPPPTIALPPCSRAHVEQVHRTRRWPFGCAVTLPYISAITFARRHSL